MMTRKSVYVAGVALAALCAANPALAQQVHAEGDEIGTAIRAMRGSMEAFQARADEQLGAVAARLDQCEARLGEVTASADELMAAQTAQRLNGGGSAPSPEGQAYAATFVNFFRFGGDHEGALKAMAVQAGLTTGSDPDGGYLVPTEMSDRIRQLAGTASRVRQLAEVVRIGGGSYEVLVDVQGEDGGWVGETQSRGDTEGPKLAKLTFTPGEIYAKPKASQRLLDSAAFDVAGWLGTATQRVFGRKEGAAFINGDGVEKPKGILSYDKVADASWSWGKLGFVISGGSAGFAATNPWQALSDVVTALAPEYRANARWLMNRKTLGAIDKFADADGRPIFRGAISIDQPATLLGYPIEIDDNMPDIGAGAFPIAFADFQAGYVVVDQGGVRVLRDPYSQKPFVEFYTTMYVGGGVQNFEAIKLLKIADS